MLNINTMLFVGFAVFAVISIAPVAVPLLESIMNSMNFAPRRY